MYGIRLRAMRRRQGRQIGVHDDREALKSDGKALSGDGESLKGDGSIKGNGETLIGATDANIRMVKR